LSGGGDAFRRRGADDHLPLCGVARDPRGRDRERGDVVLLRQAIDHGVELRELGVAQERAGEEARLERRPRLERDVVQSAVVDDAVVTRDRLIESRHVHGHALRNDRRVRDRQLHLVGDDRLLHVLA